MFPLFFLLLAAELQQSLQKEEPMLINIKEDIKKEIEDMHNKLRREVNPPASNMMKMTWSNEVASSAEEWAIKCTGTQTPKDELTLDGISIGETILLGDNPMTWGHVLRVWLQPGKDFKYGKTENKQESVTYTQMVWDRSRRIGCAVANCPQNKLPFFYVCRYLPAGNLEGILSTPYKTGQPCGECPDSCEDKLCTSNCDYYDNSLDCSEGKKTHNCEHKWMIENCKGTCNCKP